MPRRPIISGGIALVRQGESGPEVLLVHPGGPFWARKDEHAWSIPKGEIDSDIDSDFDGADSDDVVRATAVRELAEETGHRLEDVIGGEGGRPLVEVTDLLVALPEMKIASGKVLRAFAAVGDLDADTITSTTFEMEWPPRSGRQQSFPEVDRGSWYTFDDARRKLHKGQVGLVEHLEAAVREGVLKLG